MLCKNCYSFCSKVDEKRKCCCCIALGKPENAREQVQNTGCLMCRERVTPEDTQLQHSTQGMRIIYN